MQGSVSGVLEKQTEVFGEGLGILTGTTAKRYVVSDQSSKFFKPRSVMYALKRKVEDELDRSVQTKVIEPVRYSDWATPIVPVLKAGGKVRICGDYKSTVNRVCHMEQYPILTLDDLCEKVTGGKQFTKLDLTHAYSQILTINKHKRLFRYNLLPYGISSAPAISEDHGKYLAGHPACR